MYKHDVNSLVKRCAKCGEIKLKEEFFNQKSSPDGKGGYCKVCVTANTNKVRKENPEKQKEYRQKYRQTELGKQRRKEQKQRWQQRDSGKISNSRKRSKRRQKKQITPKEFLLTHTQWTFVLHILDNVCVCCGTECAITIDHIYPLCMGGMDTTFNVQPLCRSCNSKKQAKFIDYRPDWFFYVFLVAGCVI